MQAICHRCGGELPTGEMNSSDGRSPFCPHCGAPQLLLSDYAEPLSTGTEEAVFPVATSTGNLPPPRPNQIDWKLALRSATIVAGIAVVLSAIGAKIPNVSPISTIWIISSSLTTLALYQRRRPLASMNAGIGAKIGILVGITLVFALGAALSVGTVIARFSLHAMGGFDSDTARAMKLQIDQVSATRPIPAESMALINSLQFRTTMMLAGFGIVLFFVFLISIFGGAVAGLLRTRRAPVA